MNRVGMSNESGLNEMGLASKLLTQNVLYDIYLKLFLFKLFPKKCFEI